MKYKPYQELKAKKWKYEIMRNTMSITNLTINSRRQVNYWQLLVGKNIISMMSSYSNK